MQKNEQKTLVVQTMDDVLIADCKREEIREKRAQQFLNCKHDDTILYTKPNFKNFRQDYKNWCLTEQMKRLWAVGLYGGVSCLNCFSATLFTLNACVLHNSSNKSLIGQDFLAFTCLYLIWVGSTVGAGYKAMRYWSDVKRLKPINGRERS